MNISAEKGKEIKSQRARELEELRSKGVAKSRREWLKDCKFCGKCSGSTLSCVVSLFLTSLTYLSHSHSLLSFADG